MNEEILSYIESHREIFRSLSDQIWEFAELSMQEFRSAACYLSLLEQLGFQVEKHVAACRRPSSAATAREAGVGILGDLTRFPVFPRRRSHSCGPFPPAACGHGCGHNLLGAASLAAAAAVKHLIETGKLRGTVVFYGCPGEEGCSGNAFMARAGMFRVWTRRSAGIRVTPTR